MDFTAFSEKKTEKIEIGVFLNLALDWGKPYFQRFRAPTGIARAPTGIASIGV